MSDEKKQATKIIELDESDVLIAPKGLAGDPLLCWCYTSKFDKSTCLRDTKTGKTLILINLQNLRGKALLNAEVQQLPLIVGLYLDYSVIHELVHYCDEEHKVEEKVWDAPLIKLVLENWREELEETT